jgi:hypothetical protein
MMTSGYKTELTILACLLTLILGVNSTMADNRYGRLFSTQPQRATLEALRNKFSPNKVTRIIAIDSKKKQKNTAQKRTPTLSVIGAMTRSNGQTSVWTDNTMLNTKQQFEQGVVLEQRPDGGITVKVNKADTIAPLHLKPGQTLIWKTGEIIENYKVKPDEKKATNTK